MRFIIFITTLLAFVWSCYWFIMSNKYSAKVSLWSDIGSANVSAHLDKIRGFPNRFDTTITDLEIKQKREALENVLIPFRLDENLDLLKREQIK